MELPPVGPEKAWLMAIGQLKMDMPKAAFDTWVQHCEFVFFDQGKFTIGVYNQYNRDWLASRLTSTLARLLTGIMNQTVDVQFIVLEQSMEAEDDQPEGVQEQDSTNEKQPVVLTLQAEYQSIYDEIVQPDQVIVFPGYFLRYIPLLGVELAWLYIGFRQAAYEAGAVKKPGKKFGAPAKKIARYSGLSPRSFWRWAAKEETWKKLRWLVKPVDDEPRWSRGQDGRPHRSSRYYRVSMSLPLTPYDEISLRKWLYRQLGEGKSPIAALQTALETSVEELFPLPDTPLMGDFSSEPNSVQQVLQAVCGPIQEAERAIFQELAEKLAQHLMPPKDLVFLTHYFVEHWLPKLGPGPGWFVTTLRDRCYLNRRTGEIRDEVKLTMGYEELALLLGLKRVKTVWEWLRSETVRIFVREIGRDFGAWESAPRRFKVCLGEPMIPEDRTRANQPLAVSEIGASGINREAPEANSIGANGTDGESGSADNVGADGTHNGADDTYKHGAGGTKRGANDTDKIGASGTFDWRKWHRLNTLSLGYQKPKNTPTTSPGRNGSKSDDLMPSLPETVVGSKWNIGALLTHNRVSSKNRSHLLENEVDSTVFVSWLLYAASPRGKGIRDPVAHAIRRLVEDPTSGAGQSYDRLANLSPRALFQLIERALNWQIPSNLDWRKAMKGSKQGSLRSLAEQLGFSVSDRDDW